MDTVYKNIIILKSGTLLNQGWCQWTQPIKYYYFKIRNFTEPRAVSMDTVYKNIIILKSGTLLNQGWCQWTQSIKILLF